jgi:UDP-2,3-diacylglucosamine hydrolase
MRLWVFSDLHLHDPQSAFYHSFLKILDEPKNAQDHVVFAGDIFDVFVGNSSYFRLKYRDFFEAVQVLSTRQVKLFYIEGNHDFHIKHQFQDVAITFENESVQLKAETAKGVRLIYIAHGDLVDESDLGYLRLRRFFRSQTIKFLTQLISGKWIEKVGELLSRSLVKKQHDLPEDWSVEDRDRLRAVFRKFAIQKQNEGSDYVILGHCHDFDGIFPFYWNMGFPPVHQNFLFYDSLDDCVMRKTLQK